ncbi:hypothetical protein HC725_06415 [Vibrio sp. S17_S38]|uniref:DUF1281 family ferredoxin-like fold protein n=1 Tax=Vibrio sp. S17_S38 TaxID=2720229 RepID=UPI00167FF517|nr:hypothetical protein [Vibrio sp. S17_S38]MBD1572913.1 hypothetical protein [Vibrio sp. S17_S38]
MPNHVTTIVQSDSAVIESMLNGDRLVDFNLIIPKHQDLELGSSLGINLAAESAANLMCMEPTSNNELIAKLELINRLKTNAIEMTDECFEQFVQMMRNKRSHGFYHVMDFARNAWGTKWNAYDQSAEINTDCKVTFDTAWSHPAPVILFISKKFPNSVIKVNYADEDLGSNCGFYTIQNGNITTQNIAPNYSEQNESEKKYWAEFAFKIKHPDGNPTDWGMDKEFNYIED